MWELYHKRTKTVVFQHDRKTAVLVKVSDMGLLIKAYHRFRLHPEYQIRETPNTNTDPKPHASRPIPK